MYGEDLPLLYRTFFKSKLILFKVKAKSDKILINLLKIVALEDDSIF